jgi:glycosidase
VDVSTLNNYEVARKLLGKKKAMELVHYASRDNARTPVQWSSEKNAGFTDGEKPWFFVNPNYTEINVAAQENDPDSILNYYRKLIRFRKENDIVIYGSYEEYNKESDQLFVYGRFLNGKKMLAVNSFSDKNVAFTAPADFTLSEGRLALSNYKECGIVGNGFTLRPYETRVYLFD